MKSEFGQPRLLILDDMEAYIRALERALRREWDVSGASTTYEARHVAEARPEVALVDVRLVEDDPDNREGLDFVRWLRSNGYRLPIVAMSALDDPSLPVEAEAAGADRFIAKPIRVSELRRLLRELLASASARLSAGKTTGPFPTGGSTT